MLNTATLCNNDGGNNDNTNNEVKQIYKRIKLLGRGAYAKVYKAIVVNNITNTTNTTNTTNEKDEAKEEIALKKYITCNNGNGVEDTALKEIALLKMFRHPNIIEMYEYSLTAKGHVSLVLYPQDLEAYIKSGPINDDQIKVISYQILRGLYYLHSNGIIHRDIKPQNVLLCSDQNRENRLGVVLIDFGLAERIDIIDRKIIKTDLVCTLWYRSPDVLLGSRQYHFELDMWSLGCVIGEMILRKPVFKGSNEDDQLKLIFEILGTPTKETWPDITRLYGYSKITKDPLQISTFDTYFNCPDQNVDLVDLLKNLLTYDPSKRILVHEAINHPYFKNLPLYIINTYPNKIVLDFKIKWLENMKQRSKLPLNMAIYYQNDITERMRIVLLDWLIEVCQEHCWSESIYLRAQGILDRYCYYQGNVTKKTYQLLGIVSLWIASKLVEGYPYSDYPSCSNLVYLCDNTYENEEIIQMEKEILRVVDMDIYFPITTDFISSLTPNDKPIDNEEINFLLVYSTFNLDLMKYSSMFLCQIVINYLDNNNTNKILQTWIDQGIKKNLRNVTDGISGWAGELMGKY